MSRLLGVLARPPRSSYVEYGVVHRTVPRSYRQPLSACREAKLRARAITAQKSRFPFLLYMNRKVSTRVLTQMYTFYFDSVYTSPDNIYSTPRFCVLCAVPCSVTRACVRPSLLLSLLLPLLLLSCRI